MNFVEHDRITDADENVHIYSTAYAALNHFEAIQRQHEAARRDLAEAHRAFTAATADLEAAEQAFIRALQDHYGADSFPAALDTAMGTLVFHFPEDGPGHIQVIKTASYCDLYRIERADKPAA